MGRIHWIAFALACSCGSGIDRRSALTITMVGLGRGGGFVVTTISGSPPQSCDVNAGTCTHELPQGAAVTLAAAPNSGSLFDHWSGDCSANGLSCTLTMDAAKHVTATFRPTANLVFMTTKNLAMPFGATPDAAQAAADKFCNDSAAAAGQLPGSYVAWLSTSTRNAADKLGSANGWVTMDGRPFASSHQDLVAGHILYPLSVGEDFSGLIQDGQIVATGTQGDGTVSPGNTCADWTSTFGRIFRTGQQDGGSEAWTSGGVIAECAGPFALYCFENTRTGPALPSPRTEQVAFVSKGTLQPGPGTSRATADAICQSEAQAASLPGQFLAALAVTGETPLGRFSTAGDLISWSRTDDVGLVSSSKQLIETPRFALDAALDVTADKTYVPLGGVWTGSGGAGSPGANLTCGDWGSSTGLGAAGTLQEAFQWFNKSEFGVPCSTAQPVFCFQL